MDIMYVYNVYEEYRLRVFEVNRGEAFLFNKIRKSTICSLSYELLSLFFIRIYEK